MFKTFNIFNSIKSGTIWNNIFIILAILLIILGIISFLKPVKEGFTFMNQFTEKTGDDIYDDFYVGVYDELFLNDTKNEFEENKIISITKPNKTSKFLDVGSGTGHHVNDFHKKGYNIIGIDKSDEMINYSREKYPDINVKKGDVLTTMVFNQAQFTHIMCLYFTIYNIDNKREFFANAMTWLRPGGYLILHLVNRDSFEALVPGSGTTTTQQHNKERLTTSNVNFNNFTYKADFNPKSETANNQSVYANDVAIFREIFKDKSGNIRQNTHKLYMPTQKKILEMARDAGFIIIEKNNLEAVQFSEQYIYILQKPN